MSDPDQTPLPSSAVPPQRREKEKEGGERFLAGVVLQSLKWIIIIFFGVVLVVTTVVITVNRLDSRTGGPRGQAILSEEFTAEVPILDWYSEIGEVRGSTADAINRTFLIVPHIGYDVEDRAVRDELGSRNIHIREIISFYFASRTVEELKGVENRQRVKSDLATQINRIMKNGKIRDVAFDNYQLLEF